MLAATLFSAVLWCGCGPRVVPVEEVSVRSSGVEIRDAAVEPTVAAAWPWWRGPLGNGIAADEPLPTSWSERENVVWKAPVPGRGHSSPIVCGEQVLLATADEARQQQSVLAFDRATGQPQWQRVVSEGGFPSSGQMHVKSTHANGTLACDGQRVYGAFLAHDKVTAFALDLAGQILWTQEVCTFNSKFGYAPSPLIYKSTVIYAADNQGGGCLAALDRESGQIAWRKSRPAIATYSSPIMATVAGREQLLLSGCNWLVSYDPRTGAELWTFRGLAEATCGTVVWNEQHVFASGGYPESETVCVLADGSGKRVWSNGVRVYEPSMIVYQGHLYLVTDNGIAHCFDAATGAEKWKERLRGSFSASPIICNGLIYVSNDRGQMYVYRASPAGYEKVAENQLGSDAYASPAVDGGQLFLRVGAAGAGGRQEMLYCIGLPTTSPSASSATP